MGTLTNVQAACFLAQAGWPASLIPTMVAIGHPESGLRTDAVNPVVVDGAHATGWLQVLDTPDRQQWNLLDPLQNAQAARAVYQSQGLDAWTTFSDGSYRGSLSQVEADLSGWTPAQCGVTSAQGSSSGSSSGLGITAAASHLTGSITGIAQVGLGVAVIVVAVLLVLSQTGAGGGAVRAAARGGRLLAQVLPR